MLARERGGMSEGEPQTTSEAGAVLARLGLADLRPVYQPVVDLRDGRVVGYEALVRGGPAAPPGAPPAAAPAPPTAPPPARGGGAGRGARAAAPPPPCREAAVRGFDLAGAG